MGELVFGAFVFVGLIVAAGFALSRMLLSRREIHLRVTHEQVSANHGQMARLLDRIMAYDKNSVLGMPPEFAKEAERLIQEYYERVA